MSDILLKYKPYFFKFKIAKRDFRETTGSKQNLHQKRMYIEKNNNKELHSLLHTHL